jgi:hypothetical protein
MFSLLEKDQKSFDIIIAYLDFFLTDDKEKNIFDFDNNLQKQEIKDHLRRNNFGMNNQNEMCNWVIANGKNYRQYLNACKFIASMIEKDLLTNIIIKKNVNREYVNCLIELYDERIQSFINLIY